MPSVADTSMIHSEGTLLSFKRFLCSSQIRLAGIAQTVCFLLRLSGDFFLRKAPARPHYDRL